MGSAARSRPVDAARTLRHKNERPFVLFAQTVPMPKLSEKTQAQRRSRILDAAELCFVRSGFHGATMQDIRRQAGVSAGALYVYFRSKEELIEGLSLRDRAEVREEFARAAAGGDLVEGLARVLKTSAIDKPIDKVRLLIEMGAQASRSPAVSKTLRDCDADICGALEEILAAAAARGQIRPTMPIPQLAAMLIMVVDGLFWRRAADPDFDAAAIGPHILRMFATACSGGAPPIPISTPPRSGRIFCECSPP